jgi:hypothetical protein
MSELEILTKLNDICSQVNTNQKNLMKFIYNNFISGKSKDTYEQFKKKIILRHRPLFKPPEEPLTEEEDAQRCKYLVWDKGVVRRCKRNHPKGSTYCKSHIDKPNLLNGCDGDGDGDGDGSEEDYSTDDSTESDTSIE